ncbi:MAG: hypothetical protein H0T85_07335 [Geodermatophilaceae bacterium]|nr:hypothetical protein [Geodermatophilaceae bacterium]
MNEIHENNDGPEDTDAAVQLGTEETLDGPLGTDPLDAGFSPNDRPIAMNDFGTTADEMSEGESLEDRLDRELPDTAEVDEQRSGRLVEPDEGVREDSDAQLVATDVGIDGGAASAEEAAVHDVEGDRLAGDGTDEGFSGGLQSDVDAVTAAVDAEADRTDPALEADAEQDAAADESTEETP